jgi:hypothetical protein
MAFEQLMAEAQIKKETKKKEKTKKDDPTPASSSQKKKPGTEEEYGNTSFNESWSREKTAGSSTA